MSTARNEDSFFRNRFTTPAAYLVAVLLFFLPFAEIRCNDVVVAQNSGFGLAVGNDFRANSQIEAAGRSLNERLGGSNESSATNHGTTRGKMYVLALAALLLGVAGLLISYLNPALSRVTMIIGILAALSLLITMFQVKSDIEGYIDKNNGREELSQDLARVSFTIWYYLSLVSFIAAAFFAYKRSQLDAAGARIPQVPIENPGDQSEFPKSASESELG